MRRFLLGFMVGVLALPLVGVVAAGLGLFPINSNTNAPAWESKFAHMALDASAARHAPKLVFHPSTKPDFQLFWIVRGGVRYSGMFAWGGQFAPDANGKDVSDEKIWTAVTFLTHLNSLPPAVDAEWRKRSSN